MFRAAEEAGPVASEAVDVLLANLVEPRSPGTVRRAKVDLPRAEVVVQAQLLTCGSLAELAGTASVVLKGASAELRRKDAGLGGLDQGPPLCAQEDSTASRAREGLLAACGGLGEALLSLSGVMVGEVLEPLREMQRCLEERHEKEKAELASLEERELQCNAALVESKARQDKASVKLRQRLHERDRPRSSRQKMLSFTSQAERDARLERAALAQARAVEELANQIDQVTLARQSKDNAVDALCRLMSHVDQSSRKLLRESIGCCARAWERTALTMQELAAKLRSTAVELEAAPPEVPAPPPLRGPRAGQGASGEKAQARAGPLVPRLRLDKLTQQLGLPQVKLPLGASQAHAGDTEATSPTSSSSCSCSSSASSSPRSPAAASRPWAAPPARPSAHSGDDGDPALGSTREDDALQMPHRSKDTFGAGGGGPGTVACAPAARPPAARPPALRPTPAPAQAWNAPPRLGGPALGGPSLGSALAGPSLGRGPLAAGAATTVALDQVVPPAIKAAPHGAGGPAAGALGPRPTQQTPARPFAGSSSKQLRDPAATDMLFRQLPARTGGPSMPVSSAKSRTATRASSLGGLPVRMTPSAASTASESGRWL